MATPSLGLNNIEFDAELLAITSILLISLVHFVGFLDLDTWLDFSGIGHEAQRLEEAYGRTSIILLNLSAGIFFFLLTFIFRQTVVDQNWHIVGIFLSSVFVLRGVGGYLMVITGKMGTATIFWEFVFSSWALLTGILMLKALEAGL